MTYLVYPLICGMIYPLATLLLKQVMTDVGGPWKVTFISNVTMAGLYLPLLLVAQAPGFEAHGWQPLAAGCSFFGGQIFTFLSLSRGDASVATPLLGTKVIFVSLFSVWLIHQAIPLSWWLAAGITTLALAFLGKTGRRANPSHHHGLTVIYATVSALCFALTDVFTQKFTPAWGFAQFAPRMFGTTAILSLSLIPFFRPASKGLIGKSPGLLLLGSVLLAIQSLGMCYVLGRYGRATAVNIVYNSRGIFSVLTVWWVGHWFSNSEREAGFQVMLWRLAGAALLLSAIGLVVSN